LPSPLKEKRSKSPCSAKTADASGEPSVFSYCELRLMPVDNLSNIGVIHKIQQRKNAVTKSVGGD
jgi:hypothetical protein